MGRRSKGKSERKNGGGTGMLALLRHHDTTQMPVIWVILELFMSTKQSPQPKEDPISMLQRQNEFPNSVSTKQDWN